jgi:hypothetical protein
MIFKLLKRPLLNDIYCLPLVKAIFKEKSRLLAPSNNKYKFDELIRLAGTLIYLKRRLSGAMYLYTRKWLFNNITYKYDDKMKKINEKIMVDVEEFVYDKFVKPLQVCIE